MVWIYGGAYTFGTSGLPEYDGRALARRGVVVVTLNYRVGLEGFGLIPGTPPNRGLLDQVAALQWVQANIASFGGDPARVTVFGQSAGAGSIAALLVMPRSRGLFARAIVQSMPGTYFAPDLAADVTRVCAAELGLAPDELTSVDAHVLPAAAEEIAARIDAYVDRWGRPAYAGILFAPVVDGDVLPTTPWAGLPGDVELLVGHTRDEQRLLSVLSGSLGSIGVDAARSIAEVLSPDPAGYIAAFADPEELEEVVRSDWLFRMPSLKLAEAQLTRGGAAHLYELAWACSGMGGILGACHGLDVPLVFGNLTVGATSALIGEPTDDAVAVSGNLQSAWVDFATTGDPGWPAYASGVVRVFDSEPTTGAYPEQTSADLWRGRYPQVCMLTVDPHSH